MLFNLIVTFRSSSVDLVVILLLEVAHTYLGKVLSFLTSFV